MKIGVIGYGVVGSAVGEAFTKAGLDVAVFDKYKKIGSIEHLSKADVIFIAVPTPTVDGLQDIRPLREVLTSLSAASYKGPVVIKCTVLPGTCDMLKIVYPDLHLLHNPEFLTERNAKQDFMNQKVIPLSGKDATSVQAVIDAFAVALPNARVTSYSDYKATELGKYIHNATLAVKVALMNQWYLYAKEIGTGYSLALSVATEQGVIGESHTKVPGPDGQLGFAGACFPKDTEALLHSSSTAGRTLSILNEAVRFNKTIRK